MSVYYTMGKAAARSLIGLSKVAAINAKTILPSALDSAIPEAYEQSLKSLTKPGVKSVTGVTADSPAALKYLNFLGEEVPGESATSKWFRGQITEEALPYVSSPARLPRDTELPSSLSRAEMATMPPPSKK